MFSFNPLTPTLGKEEREAEGHPQTPARALPCTPIAAQSPFVKGGFPGRCRNPGTPPNHRQRPAAPSHGSGLNRRAGHQSQSGHPVLDRDSPHPGYPLALPGAPIPVGSKGMCFGRIISRRTQPMQSMKSRDWAGSLGTSSARNNQRLIAAANTNQSNGS